MKTLVRKPVQPHRFRFHKWEAVDGMAGLFGMVRQCQKCNLVEVFNPISMITFRGSHAMLRDN